MSWIKHWFKKNISNSTYAFLNLVNNAGRNCEKFNRHNNKTATYLKESSIAFVQVTAGYEK